MSFKIEGLDGLLKKLDDIRKGAGVEESLEKACLVVEKSAKQKVPKDSGTLGRSITSSVEKNGDEIVGVVGTNLEYAPYVEYGTGLFAESGGRKNVPWVYEGEDGKFYSTKGQKPQPFLRPALYENKQKIIKILGEDLIK